MRLININRYAQPRPIGAEPTDNFVYSNDPAVQLQLIEEVDRHIVQKSQIDPATKPTYRYPEFGDSLEHAFYIYDVLLLSNLQADDRRPIATRTDYAPLGIGPIRPAGKLERQDQLRGVSTLAGPIPPLRQLCLFNAIVAFEWVPSERYLLRMELAFQRASHFLYDVTDGYMAFGQVLFGGPELMSCADIQILASDRLLPRSWVNGLHEPTKYKPIRVGRGLWNKNTNVSIPWDEPEAYRTLIHEWSHYALGLKDQYLDPVKVIPATKIGRRNVSSQLLIATKDLPPATRDSLQGSSDVMLVIAPSISLPIESIMATLEGTSELVPHKAGSRQKHKVEEWEVLSNKQEFRQLRIPPDHKVIDGPGQLPLPLPSLEYTSVLDPKPAELILTLPKASNGNDLRISDKHCWVYLIQGADQVFDPKAILSDPQQIIAQGSVDSRSVDEGFTLLGAQLHNIVVLIGNEPTAPGVDTVTPLVLWGQLTDISTPTVVWSDAPATFTPIPIIDVIPTKGSEQTEISISVQATSGGVPITSGWVFPLGTTGRAPIGAAISVSTLDGLVYVRSEDGSQLAITTFSQGGGPSSSFPVGPNPVAAGSADGNAMLFFYDEGQKDYSDVKVITTMNQGVALSADKLPRSYTFSLAGNGNWTALELGKLLPTLILFYDRDALPDEGDLLICRHIGGDQWEPIPTYLPPGRSFAAAPLTSDPASGTAPGLFQDDAPTVERYRLCVVKSNALLDLA